MRIFALETDFQKVKRAFLSEGEQELFAIHYHPFLFYFRVIRQFVVTLFLAGIAYLAFVLGLPALWAVIGFFVLWIWLALPSVITTYIDWLYDAVVVTNEKIIIIDQTSLFHVEVRQMYMENFASVNAATQFWNLFPFGMLCFDLKEGVGQRLCLRYIPRAEEAALKIGNIVRTYYKQQLGQQQIQRPS